VVAKGRQALVTSASKTWLVLEDRPSDSRAIFETRLTNSTETAGTVSSAPDAPPMTYKTAELGRFDSLRNKLLTP